MQGLSYEYKIFKSIPDDLTLGRILNLHQDIFGTADNFIHNVKSKPSLLVFTALEGENVIGYKIGYPIDHNKFYSWLGGVASKYRNQGIAAMLMEKQHQYLIENGYKLVQTKTMNKWRGMLILNIKSGFDVIETYTDEKGVHKILLEKKLY